MFANPEEVFGGAGPLLGLIDLIYATVEDPTLWSGVLEEIAEAIRGESTTIFASFPASPVVSVARIDHSALTAYVNYYAAINPLSHACDDVFPEGQVRYGHQAMADRELERSEFYNDFFKPNNMHHSMGLKIRVTRELPAIYLSCQRPKESGPFSGQEGVVYETLRPHLQRALTLHLKMHEMRARQLGLETALDAFHHAVLGLSQAGKVVFASQQAEALLKARDGIEVFNGELTVSDAKSSLLLRAAIREAVRGPIALSMFDGAILVRRRSGVPLQVTVIPHTVRQPGREAMAALVFLGDPQRAVPSKAALLRSMYGLSPTESRVADLLADGWTVEEIADRIKTTAATARFHVKKIFAKTGTRRQAELMKLMLTLPGV